MSIEFITFAIVIVVLMLFTVLILRNLAAGAAYQIRGDMIRLLRAYDHAIDAKSQEIEALDAKRRALEADLDQLAQAPAPPPQNTAPAPPPIPSASLQAAHYRTAQFQAGYEAIKENFTIGQGEREALLEEILQQETAGPLRGDDAARLLESLTGQAVYSLSQLQPQAQLELLDTTLSDEDWQLLRDYCDQHPMSQFDVILFRQWLEELATLECAAFSIRCGDSMVSGTQDLEYNSEICEGIQICVGNRIYDFSINGRDVI